MFRIFWSPGSAWQWFRDGDPVLEKHIQKRNYTDCYTTLNVYPMFEKPASYYDFGFDFDSPNIAESAGDALKVMKFLEGFSVVPSISFSGSKGIHLVVPHTVVGVEARNDGGHVCKLVQEHIATELKLTTLDLTIHGAKRQWRIPNTINSKSGLFKISLYEGELHGTATAADVEHLRGLAQRAREIIAPSKEYREGFNAFVQPFIEKANAENKEQERRLSEQKAVTLKALPVCMLGILNDPAKVIRQAKTWGKTVPNRNQLTFLAATFFRTHADCGPEETFKILGPTWQKKVEALSINTPMDQIARSTHTCIQSVHSRGFDFSCGNAITHGCECSPGCPLFRPMPPKEEEPKV